MGLRDITGHVPPTFRIGTPLDVDPMIFKWTVGASSFENYVHFFFKLSFLAFPLYVLELTFSKLIAAKKAFKRRILDAVKTS